MPITSPGNDDDTGENHQPTLRKNTAEPVEQTLKQNKRVERVLDVFGVTRSLSRPGNPYDSAVVESTNRLVRKELIHRNVYTNVEQPRSDVNRYVWWYNHQRLHSTLGYLSPVEFTQQGKTL